VVVQFFLAGAGVFRAKPTGDKRLFESSTFAAHRGLGWILQLGALLLLLLALLARPGRRRLIGSAVLFILLIAQGVLSEAGDSAPWVAALHPVNGLLILALASFPARDTRRSARAARSG
jgi:peptidoglycan/LPS O-acetylase OafA/YrhL